VTPCRYCGARWRLHDEWLCPKRPAGEIREALSRAVAPRKPTPPARMTPAQIDAEVAKFAAQLAATPDAEEPKR
jgi:hypothetical protein